MPELKFTAGRLLCGRLRDFLKLEQWSDPSVQFYESSGLFSHDFVVKANDLSRIESVLEDLKQRLER